MIIYKWPILLEVLRGFLGLKFNTNKLMLSMNKLNDVVSSIYNQAIYASSQKTFAVAGAIVDNKTGKVIHKLHNNVIKPLKNGEYFTYDPTAHGERQLVYWYYENRKKLSLPDPNSLTILTTLDPCAMCTGILLTAGFNVGIVAIDDFAGINYDSQFKFHDLPQNIRKEAKNKLGYYKVAEGPSIYTRSYVGGDHVIFKEGDLSVSNLISCKAIFESTVNNVKIASSSSGQTIDKLTDPATLSNSSNITKAFRNIYSNAFKIKTKLHRRPCEKIYKELLRVKEKSKSANNSVAFIDPFGNLVLCYADRFDISPVHTSFMSTTMNYAITRWNLINDFKVGDNPNDYLTHPKFGTFVFLYAPDYNDPATIMNLGAYGSTLEGPVPDQFPSNLQFFLPPKVGTFDQLVETIQNLPPFYTNFAKIAISQVAGVVK